MTDSELREMIRESIARQSGAPRTAFAAPDPAAAFRAHVSHRRLPLATGGDEDGNCVIEPAVKCTHCGFCVSFGH